jgi:hypothetical protein
VFVAPVWVKKKDEAKKNPGDHRDIHQAVRNRAGLNSDSKCNTSALCSISLSPEPSSHLEMQRNRGGEGRKIRSFLGEVAFKLSVAAGGVQSQTMFEHAEALAVALRRDRRFRRSWRGSLPPIGLADFLKGCARLR